MKTRFFLIIISILWNYHSILAQSAIDRQLLQINRQIDSIIKVKVTDFKQQLKDINRRLAQKVIDRQQAEAEKKELAKRYAEDLDYTVFKLTNDLKRAGKGQYIMDSVSAAPSTTAYNVRKVIMYRKHYYDKKVHKNKQTFAYLFVSAGFNNLIDNDQVQSLEFSPYGYLQSRFFELGIDWKTNIMHQKVFVNYGASFIWHTLKPTDNKFHIVDHNQVVLVTHPYDLETSKLRHIWLRLPLQLELNFPNANRGHLHLTGGFYGKFRLTTKQKLTYVAGNDNHDEVIKNSYLMPSFAYGISGGFGGSDWEIFAQYDITPLFKYSQKHLVSLGFKWRL